MGAPTLEDIFGSYMAWKAEEDTWFISFMNGTQMLYLLEGSEKALLIDTGYAIGNLRPFVEKLTDKPVTVINTHFHPDHSGGNGEWEKVLVHPDWRIDSVSVLHTAGNLNALPFPDYEKVCVTDGDVIDLGGREIEIKLAANAHCNSALYLLDRTKGMLFMGDEIDPAQVILVDNSKNDEEAKTYSFDRVLKNYRANLLWAKSRSSEFTWLLGNHNGTPLAKSYIDEGLQLIDSIYAGTAKIHEKLNHKYIEMDPNAPKYCRVSHGNVSFIVNRSMLMGVYGKGIGKTQATNPYLPFWETVPDGEPHVFGDRVYIYGSHDRAGGENFCLGDYACWSAPVDDLGSWRFEGIIYHKVQDPINGAPYSKPIPEYDSAFDNGQAHLLYAPDVAQGPDGRYYLYYSLDFTNIVSVAVCDTPAGHYEFLDFVTRADGTRPNIGRWFDPAILSEAGGNYMYYGFCPPFRFPGMESLDIPGGMVVQLADDMHTIIGEPHCTANGCDTCKGTPYEIHPFFEASSIRHYGDWYYLAYSSLQGHELCYGMAKTPVGPFEYKGILHSNGDLGLNGNTEPDNYTGNNHGGLVKIGDDYYIFGHRHTHGTAYSRQGVAEKITMNPDGTFEQAELTSCGLNGGPLNAAGIYSAHIACCLKGPNGAGQVVMTSPEGGALVLPADMPYITEESCEYGIQGLRPYIANLTAGAVCGFRYFAFTGSEAVSVTLRGKGTIGAALTPDGQILASAEFDTADWGKVSLDLAGITGTQPLYFRIISGNCDITAFEFC